MKGFLKFIIVFAGILLLSAVLAPILHNFMPHYSFARIFNRIVMIGVLLAVVIFVRFRNEMFVRFGMDWRKDSLRLFWTGYLTVAAVLALFTLTQLLAGNASVSLRVLTWQRWVYKLLGCLGGGLLIGIMEEFFFRGFIFTSLRDRVLRGSVLLAMVMTSVFYAAIHFVSIRKPVISLDPGFMDSLKMIAAPIQSFANWHAVWPAAIGLFLFGMILNYCAVRTRSLYPSIGLHAGAVFFVRSIGLFISFLEKNVFFWSTKKVYDGVLGWAFLLLIGLLMAKFLKKAEPLPTL
jgi:membrane protease YdiL (CAAX protease family)